MSTPPKQFRNCSFHAENAPELISKCFERDGPLIDYPSTDMKVGIDMGALEKQKTPIARLILVDVRGGFFRQGDIKKGLEDVWAHRREEITDWGALHTCTDINSSLDLMAYKLRVMMSHIREKHSQFQKLEGEKYGKAHPKWIRDIYENIVPVKPDGKEDHRQAPHPLFAFRGPEGDDDDDDDGDHPDEPATIIFKYVEPAGGEMKACALLSDGGRVEASKFTDGGNGFAIAHFKHNGEEGITLETEIPSIHIDETGAKLTIPKVAKTKASGKKRPAATKGKPAAAAKAAAVPAGAEEDGGADEAEEGDEEECEPDAVVDDATSVDEIVKAGFALLPESAADFITLQSGKKTYTIDPNTQSDHDSMTDSASPSKIQVILAKGTGEKVKPERAFYVTNVLGLPEGSEQTTNSQNGVQMSWTNCDKDEAHSTAPLSSQHSTARLPAPALALTSAVQSASHAIMSMIITVIVIIVIASIVIAIVTRHHHDSDHRQKPIALTSSCKAEP
eukprot:9484328-Pyramimonas_sp.AAC.2